jgi:hypothetical protein
MPKIISASHYFMPKECTPEQQQEWWVVSGRIGVRK